MKTLEYTYKDVDKTEWGEGPWVDEQDKVQWLDEETSLPCIIKRNGSGAWCGYVGVSKDHPAYLKDYNEVDVEVHGGLTFADRCQPHDEGEQGEAHAICHVVEDGEDDAVWWLGFDCAHGGMDYVPRMVADTKRFGFGGDKDLADVLDIFSEGTYRDQAYVTAETLNLAKQLAAIA